VGGGPSQVSESMADLRPLIVWDLFFFWVVFIYLFIFIVVGTAVGVDSGGFTLG
jgi:hypothetical protein